MRTEKLDRLWELHYRKDKMTAALQPRRQELEEMRIAMLCATSIEEANHLREERTKAKDAYMVHIPCLAAMDREMSAIARSIPGNYVMHARSGKFGRVPEALRNFRGWFRGYQIRQAFGK